MCERERAIKKVRNRFYFFQKDTRKRNKRIIEKNSIIEDNIDESLDKESKHDEVC